MDMKVYFIKQGELSKYKYIFKNVVSTDIEINIFISDVDFTEYQIDLFKYLF